MRTNQGKIYYVRRPRKAADSNPRHMQRCCRECEFADWRLTKKEATLWEEQGRKAWWNEKYGKYYNSKVQPNNNLICSYVGLATGAKDVCPRFRACKELWLPQNEKKAEKEFTESF